MYDALKRLGFTNNILRRPPGLYQAMRARIARLEAMDEDGRRAFRDKRVEAMLRAARRLPGYVAAPTSERLEDWPILTKQDVLGREADFSSFSPIPASRGETSGSTGVPLRLKRSIAGVAFEQAVIDFLCARGGVEARAVRSAFFKGDTIAPDRIARGTFWRDDGSRKRVFSAHHITAENAPRYIAALREHQPDIAFCYPSALVAAWSHNGGDYHFLHGYGHVELVPCGENRARIVATSLWPHGQIFVRYETGDVARVRSHDPDYLERVGLGLAPFDGIDGRETIFIELTDGQRIFGLNLIAYGVEGADSVQVWFDGRDCLDIYIVPGRGFGRQTCAHLVGKLNDRTRGRVKARWWTMPTPLRETSGKAQFLLRNPRFTATPEPIPDAMFRDAATIS